MPATIGVNGTREAVQLLSNAERHPSAFAPFYKSLVLQRSGLGKGSVAPVAPPRAGFPCMPYTVKRRGYRLQNVSITAYRRRLSIFDSVMQQLGPTGLHTTNRTDAATTNNNHSYPILRMMRIVTTKQAIKTPKYGPKVQGRREQSQFPVSSPSAALADGQRERPRGDTGFDQEKSSNTACQLAFILAAQHKIDTARREPRPGATSPSHHPRTGGQPSK